MRSVKILCIFSAALLALSACGTTPAIPESSTPPPATSSTSTTTTSTTTTTSEESMTTSTVTTTTASTTITTTASTTGYGTVSEEYAPPPDKQLLKIRFLTEDVLLKYECTTHKPPVEDTFLFWQYSGKTSDGHTVTCAVETKTERIYSIYSDLGYYEEGAFVTKEEAEKAVLAELRRLEIPENCYTEIRTTYSHTQVRSNYGTATVFLQDESGEATGEQLLITLYEHNDAVYITSIIARTTGIPVTTNIPYCQFSDHPYFIPQWV